MRFHPSIHPASQPVQVATSSTTGRNSSTYLPPWVYEPTNPPYRPTYRPSSACPLLRRRPWPRLFVKLALLRSFGDAASTASVHFSPLLPPGKGFFSEPSGDHRPRSFHKFVWVQLFPIFCFFKNCFAFLCANLFTKKSTTRVPTVQLLPPNSAPATVSNSDLFRRCQYLPSNPLRWCFCLVFLDGNVDDRCTFCFWCWLWRLAVVELQYLQVKMWWPGVRRCLCFCQLSFVVRSCGVFV